MNYVHSLLDLIGNTPMLRPSRYMKVHRLGGNLLLKLESFNPLSSVKDRVGVAMIHDGIQQGKIHPDTVLVEPTSGNMGIALAYACAIMEYRLILTMPDTMSMERRGLLTALGAEIVLTDGRLGMQGSIDKAKELADQNPNYYILGQFDNPANVKAHMDTTAKEILRDTDGKVDMVVAGVGTGGTLMGISEVLKAHNPKIQIVAVEPIGSAVLSGGKSGPHKLQGLGAGFVPSIVDLSMIDEIIPVKNDDAFDVCRQLAKTEGILSGISSGAALFAATKLAARPENTNKNIVVILPDTGERYLSTGLYVQ